MDQVIFGVVDPRTHEIKQVAQVKAPDIEELRRYFDKFFVERPATSETAPYTSWVCELREQGFKPGFVVLERNAGEGAKARWIEQLRSVGAELTNIR